MSLAHAIQWHWPGARCVIRGDVLERWDGPMARPTAAELAQAVTDYQAADVALLDQSQRQSRQKDILILCALRVRAKNITAWNALTDAQKVAATLTEADLWRDMRVWVEANF